MGPGGRPLIPRPFPVGKLIFAVQFLYVTFANSFKTAFLHACNGGILYFQAQQVLENAGIEVRKQLKIM